jgi:hypothetical protein
MDFERLDTALEEVEDSLNYIDCDEAYVLFVEFSVKVKAKVKEWQKLCAAADERETAARQTLKAIADRARKAEKG